MTILKRLKAAIKFRLQQRDPGKYIFYKDQYRTVKREKRGKVLIKGFGWVQREDLNK